MKERKNQNVNFNNFCYANVENLKSPSRNFLQNRNFLLGSLRSDFPWLSVLRLKWGEDDGAENILYDTLLKVPHGNYHIRNISCTDHRPTSFPLFHRRIRNQKLCRLVLIFKLYLFTMSNQKIYDPLHFSTEEIDFFFRIAIGRQLRYHLHLNLDWYPLILETVIGSTVFSCESWTFVYRAVRIQIAGTDLYGETGCVFLFCTPDKQIGAGSLTEIIITWR